MSEKGTNLILIILFLIVVAGLFVFISNNRNKPGIPEVDFNNLDLPEYCTESDPVCGADGETYKNRCIATKNHIEIAYEGACSSVISGMVDNRCTLQPIKGECSQNIEKYYFDINNKECKKYTWGGCGISAFDTLKECVDGCSSWGK